MGTSLSLRAEAETRRDALRATEHALRAVQAVEGRWSTWRTDTEAARLNQGPAQARIAVSSLLHDELERAIAWSEATGGAFDPAVGRLVQAWDLRGAGRIPTAAELTHARAASGCRHLDLEAGVVRKARADVWIEEGGFAKGIALDAAAEALRGLGVTGLLDFGGHLVSVGAEERTCEIADPRSRSLAPVATLRFAEGSVATSGNGERSREVDGRRLGHLLDPRSGRFAPSFGSLTVWTRSAFDADCLSTALYVLGPEKALQWAADHDGVEVVVVENPTDEHPRRVRVSDGLRAALTIHAVAAEQNSSTVTLEQK